MTEKEKIEMIFRALSLGFNVERTKDDRVKLVGELTALRTRSQSCGMRSTGWTKLLQILNHQGAEFNGSKY